MSRKCFLLVFYNVFSLSRGAGTGGLGLAMEGPSEAKMSCTDNKDGSCSVEYIPYEPGTYNLNITYGGQPIKGLTKDNCVTKHFNINELTLYY